ncbi:MAG TPA: class I SAM-dependent methyltransferase [Ktedonobacterales bacterium]|jgi:2-polyprenyl-3-methyl-5-hydroxy-6-metoxy-1,4-benzoquinol methylase
MQPKIDAYNDFAAQYAAYTSDREGKEIKDDPFLSLFLEVVGDVSGLTVLDAGCGEGYLARILARRGATVAGIDISPRLVEIARAKDSEGRITYQVADLSQPLPAYHQHFDLSVSWFVLNDVADYRGFLSTLGSVVKRGGRAVFFLNNPYSMVLRGQVTNYFDSGKAFPYRGMAEAGVHVYYYQRTFEEYLSACFAAGFQLQRLVDVPSPEGTFTRTSATLIPIGYHFPFFLILSLVKP